MKTTFNQLPYNVINEYILDPQFPLLSKTIYNSITPTQRTRGFYETEISVSCNTTQEEFVAKIKARPNLRKIWCGWRLRFNNNDSDEISEIPEITDIPTLIKLKELHIYYRPITKVPNLCGLRVLDCNNNAQISYIPSSLINLEELYCYETNVSEIPSSLTKLKLLDCSMTKITEIPNTLINLEMLYCYETSIKEIPDSLTKLEELSCSDTPLTKLPLTLTKLKDLEIFKTYVSEIPYTFNKLEILHCNNTPIKEIPDTFILLKYIRCNGSVKIPKNINIRKRNRKCRVDFVYN